MASAYCTIGNVKDRLSAAGVTLRTDDAPPTAYGDAILRAANKINQYLLKRYAAADLASNDWVTDVAASLAAYYLCARRGNTPPAPIAAAKKEAIDDLKEVRRGEADVPECKPRRQSCPVSSNVRVQLWPSPHVRVRRSTSTTTGGAPTDYTQHRDLTDQTEGPILNEPSRG